MRNRIAALLCALVLLAGVPLALSAQITSPTNDISFQLFRTDVDNAFDINYFSSFTGKSIGFVDVRIDDYLALGYATKLGGLYIGAAYGGNTLALARGDIKSYSTTELVDANYNLLGTRQTYTNLPTGSNSSYNQLGVLVGFGKIGVSAAVFESTSLNTSNHSYTVNLYNGAGNEGNFGLVGASSSGSNSATTTPSATGTTTDVTSYTPVTTGSTTWTPAVNAGMVLDLGGMVLRPYLNVSAAISTSDDAAISSSYTQATGSGLPTYNSITEVTSYTSYNFAKKAHSLGLDATIGSELEKDAWLYALSYEFYSPFNSSPYTGVDGTTASTVAGTGSSLSYISYSAPNLYQTTTATTYAYLASPSSSMTHTIALSAKYRTSLADKLKLAAGFAPTFTIGSSSSSSSGQQVTTTVRTNSLNPTAAYTETETKTYTGSSTSGTSFGVSPVIDAALQYAVTDTLVFNLGTDITLEKFATSTSTTTVPGYSTDKIVRVNADGTTVTNSYASTIGSPRSESQSLSWSLNSVSTMLRWGFAWTLIDGVVLDTRFTTSGASLNTTSFTALLSIKQ
jgi:hypothetical protein